MNVANILKVADAIEHYSIPNLGFNMSFCWGKSSDRIPDRSGHNCGTVACIVGWAEALEHPDRSYGLWDRGNLEDYFGIDEDTGGALACPVDFEDGNYTPAQAVRTLRHLAATGEVNWDLPELAAA